MIISLHLTIITLWDKHHRWVTEWVIAFSNGKRSDARLSNLWNSLLVLNSPCPNLTDANAALPWSPMLSTYKLYTTGVSCSTKAPCCMTQTQRSLPAPLHPYSVTSQQGPYLSLPGSNLPLWVFETLLRAQIALGEARANPCQVQKPSSSWFSGVCSARELWINRHRSLRLSTPGPWQRFESIQWTRNIVPP